MKVADINSTCQLTLPKMSWCRERIYIQVLRSSTTSPYFNYTQLTSRYYMLHVECSQNILLLDKSTLLLVVPAFQQKNSLSQKIKSILRAVCCKAQPNTRTLLHHCLHALCVYADFSSLTQSIPQFTPLIFSLC